MITNIAILDPHPIFRSGIESLLNTHQDFKIIAKFGKLTEFKKYVEQHVSKIQIVILERFLSQEDGLSIVPWLKQNNIKVIMLTSANEDFEIREAIQMGVDAYLFKSAESEHLIQALISINNGQNLYPSSIMKKMIDANLADHELQKLSHRELDIVTYVARGMSNRTIGEALSLSENTVRNHLRSILEKLNLNNRVQVATFALKRGIGKRSPAGLNPELEKSNRSRRIYKLDQSKVAE